MSTVVCQGLQSCLESQSQLVETRTLRLKLASPKPHSSESTGLGRGPCMLDGATKELTECHYEETNKKSTPYVGDNDMSSNPDLGGWSFLQALSNTSQSPKEALDKESSYVPPLVKRSVSILSEKSLELCTENLGSETGTDIIESSIFSLSSSDSESRQSPRREQPKSRQHMESGKVNSRNFPPPLTTISGMNSLQVRPHREGGRLIIKAVEAPSTHAYFQAERSHGRLRLCFLKDCNTTNFDSEVLIEENEESGKDNEKEQVENEADDEEEQEDEEEDEEEEEFEEQADEEDKDMDGNSFDGGVKMGMEKFPRPSRCKEGGRSSDGLCNWEPFWVATS